MSNQRPDSEGLIPVEHHHPISPQVSPMPSPAPAQFSHQTQDSIGPISPEPTGITPLSPSSEQSGTLLPTYEKSRQEHEAPIPVNNPPTAPEKAYNGQPVDQIQQQQSYFNQAQAQYPSDGKTYPGQPGPQQMQQHPQQQMYYTPYGHPSGYATAVPLHALQSAPCPVDCPACGRREMTRVEPVTGMTTHGWAAVLCFCCCLGCIPYLMSSLKDVDHYCGGCGTKLACWHNSGRIQVFQISANQMPGAHPVAQAPQAAQNGPQSPPVQSPPAQSAPPTHTYQ
ncbi:LPS-induced tumor necrosis factor alpha factor [Penicillium subrubescens]|uniref:LPS-induced tumor necrosis factor alpha factor n=1 Tax=Penicillium subrubescens TaxID=1316194 RepID=UPI002545BBE6|nr:LPS-induced tumor necrosis factor alpha factor [Penicillium subrubescens]KAJ5880992.1 LPS-induced tumor necrosis factor alpha factor [Penicillium subrubescens]